MLPTTNLQTTVSYTTWHYDRSRYEAFHASLSDDEKYNYGCVPPKHTSASDLAHIWQKALESEYIFAFEHPTYDPVIGEEDSDEEEQEVELVDPVLDRSQYPDHTIKLADLVCLAESEDESIAPRLVGIETNPGPTLLLTDGKSKGKTKQVIRGGPKLKEREILTVLSKGPQNAHRMLSSSSDKFLGGYVKSLVDPWEKGPMNLGYGTLIDTVLGTAYVRNSITVNADGSFGIAMQPSVAGMVLTNVSGAAGVVWTTSSASNTSSINNQMTEARVVSGGIRIFCLFPETASSGVLFGGSLPGIQNATFIGYSTQSLSQLSTSELGIGKRGARSTMLPIDMTAFNMSSATTLGYNGGVMQPWTAPYICGLGFPAATIVWYEAVLNIEGVPVSTSSAIGIDADTPGPRASDYFVTPERLMRAAGGLITQTVVMDAVQGLVSMANPRAGRLLGSVRSTFGGGSHFRQQLVAGAASQGQSRQQSVVIEEMKEDANINQTVARRGWY